MLFLIDEQSAKNLLLRVVISEMSLIPSESSSFPDHFRQTIADMRSPREKKLAPLVQREAPPSAREKRFFLLIRELLAVLAKSARPPTAAEEPPHEEGFPQLGITVGAAHEGDVPSAVEKPEASEQENPLLAAAEPQPPRERSIAAPIAVPPKLPFRKSVVPPGLKRKARWNVRAVPTQPTPAATNGASEISSVNLPNQKMTSKASRRPAPRPRFVQSAPPALVQVLLSYDAQASAPTPEGSTTAPETDPVSTLD
jgi:hypothetical protein